MLARPVLGYVLLSVAVMLLTSGLSIATGVSIARLLVIAVFPDGGSLLVAALLTAGLLLARGLSIWLREWVIAWVGVRVRCRLRAVLIMHLGDLGPAALSRQRSGEVTATIVDGVDSLDPYYARYLPSLIVSLVLPAGLLIFLWSVLPAAVVVLIAAALLATVPARLWDATLLHRGRERWRELGELSADFLDAIQAVPNLRVLGATAPVESSLVRRAHAFYASTMRQLKVSLVESGLSGLAVHGGTAAATVIAALAAWRGEIAPAAAFLILMLSREVFRPITDLGAAWHAGYLGLTAVDRIDDLLDQKPEVIFDGTRQHPAAPGCEIRFNGVGYQYAEADGEEFALRDFDLAVPAGATVALVGASGSGKTTAVRLLQRLSNPRSGRILLDGEPLDHYAAEALQASLAVVSQHSVIFNGTIADNIALGSPHATAEEIQAAAIAAEAHEFITALPDGYQATVGEFGSNLSGGQRQRLALARALLQDRPVLVLDEATAHLDVRTEAAITRRLATARNRTTIVVTHRLESVADADLIAVVADGRIVQYGPPDELTGTGPYRELMAAMR